MENTQSTRLDKFKLFLDKTHLHYLAFAFLLYGFKALLYFAIADIPCNRIGFFALGDQAIPFVKYFYVFYLGYYIVPEIFLWLLSFYDKRKVFDLVIAGAIANIICCICFLIYQIKMQRPEVNLAMEWNEVNSIPTLFDRLIVFQYNADSTALNCYPSLHATFGCMLFLLGVPLSKYEVTKDHHLPIWMRIFAIIFGLGIVASTFFIKQHYYIDALTAMVMMTSLYFITRKMIDKVLKVREATKENKKERTRGYLQVGGTVINVIAMCLCFLMFLFGLFMAGGAVVDANGVTPTPQIQSLGISYIIGFGISFLITCAIYIFTLYLDKHEDIELNKINWSYIVVGICSINPCYIISGILGLSNDKGEAK